MSELDGKKTIEQLIPELREAKKVLEDRIEEEKVASNRTTDARNAYNSLCKKMDAAVAALKQEAPWNTDWHSAVKRGVTA